MLIFVSSLQQNEALRKIVQSADSNSNGEIDNSELSVFMKNAAAKNLNIDEALSTLDEKDKSLYQKFYQLEVLKKENEPKINEVSQKEANYKKYKKKSEKLEKLAPWLCTTSITSIGWGFIPAIIADNSSLDLKFDFAPGQAGLYAYIASIVVGLAAFSTGCLLRSRYNKKVKENEKYVNYNDLDNKYTKMLDELYAQLEAKPAQS